MSIVIAHISVSFFHFTVMAFVLVCFNFKYILFVCYSHFLVAGFKVFLFYVVYSDLWSVCVCGWVGETVLSRTLIWKWRRGEWLRTNLEGLPPSYREFVLATHAHTHVHLAFTLNVLHEGVCMCACVYICVYILYACI